MAHRHGHALRRDTLVLGSIETTQERIEGRRSRKRQFAITTEDHPQSKPSGNGENQNVVQL